jgi:hypothetical protein
VEIRHVANFPCQSVMEQLSALRPLSAAERSPGDRIEPKKVLVREPIIITATPTPLTASQTVKCSLPSAAERSRKARQRLRWSEACWWARQGLNL